MNTISAVFVVVTFIMMALLWHTMNKKDPPRVRRGVSANPPSQRPAQRIARP